MMKLKTGLIKILLLTASAVAVQAEDELSPEKQISATASIPSKDVRVNSIGYKPALAKRATVMGDHGNAEWSIRSCADDSSVLSGKLSSAVVTSDSKETVQVVDFSALTAPGSYYLNVEGVGKSVPFRVADEVYNDSLELQMAGLYGLRCGMAVSISHGGNIFQHDVCHTADGKMDYVGGTGTIDGTGGWHDAGDYGKYMVNAAFSMGVMLKGWEHFSNQLVHVKLPIRETGGSFPDFLDEMKYELDWMLKNAAVYGDGRIPHKLTRVDFSGMVMPSTDKEDRYWVPYSSAATAGFTAVMAQAARIYRPYDAAYADRLQGEADKSYAWLQAHPERHDPDQAAFSTGGYGSSDSDDRLWAAAEMWETTGSPEALADFEKRASSARRKIELSWGWSNLGNLGMFAYLSSERKGKNADLEKAVRQEVISTADSVIDLADKQGFGRGLDRYFWGCNGSVALQGMVLRAAHKETHEQKYLDGAIDQISHLYGRNTYNRSQVTGEGINPPMHPHHRPSEADGISDPWPGLLVGGGWPTATDWKDEMESYETNEIAINWTAAMVYLLGMFSESNSE